MALENYAASILGQGLLERQTEDLEKSNALKQADSLVNKFSSAVGNIYSGVRKGVEMQENEFGADPEHFYLAKQATSADPNDINSKQLFAISRDIINKRGELESLIRQNTPEAKMQAKKVSQNLRLLEADFKRQSPGKRMLMAKIQGNAPDKDIELERLKQQGKINEITAKGFVESEAASKSNVFKDYMQGDQQEHEMNMQKYKLEFERWKALLENQSKGSDSLINNKNMTINVLKDKKATIEKAKQTEGPDDIKTAQLDQLDSLISLAASAKDNNALAKIVGMSDVEVIPQEKLNQIVNKFIESPIINRVADLISVAKKTAGDPIAAAEISAEMMLSLPTLMQAMSPEDLKNAAKAFAKNEFLSLSGLDSKSFESQEAFDNAINTSVENAFKNTDASEKAENIKNQISGPVKKFLGIDLPSKFLGFMRSDYSPEEFNAALKSTVFKSMEDPTSRFNKIFVSALPFKDGIDVKAVEDQINSGTGVYKLLAFRYSFIDSKDLTEEDRMNLLPNGSNSKLHNRAKEKIKKLWKAESQYINDKKVREANDKIAREQFIRENLAGGVK